MTKKYKILNLYDAKRVLPAVPIDGDGQVLHEGDRVYSYDYDVETFAPQRFYGGTIKILKYGLQMETDKSPKA